MCSLVAPRRNGRGPHSEHQVLADSGTSRSSPDGHRRPAPGPFGAALFPRGRTGNPPGCGGPIFANLVSASPNPSESPLASPGGLPGDGAQPGSDAGIQRRRTAHRRCGAEGRRHRSKGVRPGGRMVRHDRPPFRICLLGHEARGYPARCARAVPGIQAAWSGGAGEDRLRSFDGTWAPGA